MNLGQTIRQLFAIALIGAVVPAYADDYPSRSIRVVVPFGAGGVSDTISRVVSDTLSTKIGQPIFIENKPGASGTLGTEFVADAPPDGYTLLVNDPSGPLATSVSLYPARRFDPQTRLQPVAMLGTTGAVLVVSSGFPAKTIQEFIAIAKKRPGELLYASTGAGTPGHLNAELFSRIAGISAVHVPYRLGTQAHTDLISGRLSFWIIPLPSVIQHIQAGRYRALAVAGDQRSPDLPDVPTIKEIGLGDYDVSTMYALFAPARTSPAIVSKLAKATQEALQVDSVRERLRRAGVKPDFAGPERVSVVLKQKIDQWSELIKKADIQVQ